MKNPDPTGAGSGFSLLGAPRSNDVCSAPLASGQDAEGQETAQQDDR